MTRLVRLAVVAIAVEPEAFPSEKAALAVVLSAAVLPCIGDNPSRSMRRCSASASLQRD
jgi:hypothetical protein